MQVNAIGCCYGCASIDFIRYNTWTHILILFEFAESPNTGTSRLDILDYGHFIVNILSLDKTRVFKNCKRWW